MNWIWLLAFLLGILLALPSCRPIFYGIVGIRNPKPLTEKQVEHIWGIPKQYSFILDTAVYKMLLYTTYKV